LDLAAIARERSERMAKASAGKPAQPAAKKTFASSGDGGGSGIQTALLVVAAVLLGPAMLKYAYDKVTTETVDISNLNVVTSYDKPAIEMMDDTVRIQFCAN